MAVSKTTKKKVAKKTKKKKAAVIVPNTGSDPTDIDKKIAECCGVRQLEDAVRFVAFYPTATTVQVAGDFNNWQPEAALMERVGKNGVWQIKLLLSPGNYRYRLVVDGYWRHDPYNEATEVNQYGELDSLLEVR